MPLVPNFLAMVSDLVKNPEKFDKFIKKGVFLTFDKVIFPCYNTTTRSAGHMGVLAAMTLMHSRQRCHPIYAPLRPIGLSILFLRY